jgi:putative spermidine/putrescine transport system substrate-binding protein
MLNRRNLLSFAATGLLAGPSTLSALMKTAKAQGRPMTFCSWGGALSELEKQAFVDPFGKSKGMEIISASPTNYAKLKAMVEAKSPEWDLVDVGGRFIFEGAEFLEPLDMSLIPNAKALDPGWVTPKGIFTSSGATVIAWNTKAFPADKGPSSWKDFWDVKAFPGARGLYKSFYYNYEAALLAAGTKPADVYPVTDDKVKQAFDKLAELKPNVKVWWTAGAQPPQLLSSGELALSSAWSGRMFAIIKEKAPAAMTYKDGIAWGNAWVIVKGSPYAKQANELINYAISESAQEQLLSVGTYGPVLGSAAAKGTPEQQAAMATAPGNAKDMLIINEEQAGLYSKKYEAQWNKFLLG